VKPISLATPRPNSSLRAIAVPEAPSEGEPRYPVAYLDSYNGPELADEGTITFRYRVKRKTEERKPEGDGENCAYDLELTEIVKADFEEETDVDESAAEAMDRKIKRRAY